jgi:threonine dehydrogenase-like Zn-dependent dehydrogenase
MKCLLYRNYSDLAVAEQPAPVLKKPNEVLLRVAAVGICGSELDSFRQKSPRRKPPLIMGHEFCGHIQEVGSAVRGFKTGQRVVSNALVVDEHSAESGRGNPHLSAGRQVFGMHRPGAFAEYVAVPADCLITWPEDLPAEAACLAEPLANGVHVFNLVKHLAPKKVLVIGAGPIGLFCLQVFHFYGAEILISDPNRARTEIAEKLGASVAIVPPQDEPFETCRELTDGEGVDLAIDAFGSGETKRLSLQCVRPGGAVVWIGLHEDGIELNSHAITLPEKAVFGTYGARLDELTLALDLMGRHELDVSSWVEVFPLDYGDEAFFRMLRGTDRDVKAVLVP